MTNKVKYIKGREVHTMEGYLKRKYNKLYFIDEYEVEYLIDILIKVDMNKDIMGSRYLLSVGGMKYINMNNSRELDIVSVSAINGMGKLPKGTSYTKMRGIWN